MESTARLTLPDADAARAVATAPGGREFTRRVLWASISREGIDPGREPRGLDEQFLAASAGLGTAPAAPAGGPPVQPRSLDDVIEIWTERELTIVHAGWSITSWREATEASARWLCAEIQPDNATNLPWGVHAFASLAERDGDAEMAMYAETLLHNCVVSGGGRPDELSALILLDAARQLRADQTG